MVDDDSSYDGGGGGGGGGSSSGDDDEENIDSNEYNTQYSRIKKATSRHTK